MARLEPWTCVKLSVDGNSSWLPRFRWAGLRQAMLINGWRAGRLRAVLLGVAVLGLRVIFTGIRFYPRRRRGPAWRLRKGFTALPAPQASRQTGKTPRKAREMAISTEARRMKRGTA